MTATQAPALGRNFPWLWSSQAATNLADGVLLAAGPLLVTEVTLAPIAVATAVFLQRLPWLLFGVVAGALLDRWDRRRVLVLAHAARILVFGGLALAVLADALSLPVIYVAMFAAGSAETFADNAGDTMVAVTVPREGIARANARLMGVRTVTNQLAGPPIGALLFGLGVAVPFGVSAVLFAAAVVLVLQLRLAATDARQRAPLRGQVVEGLRWLWAHDAVRTLFILITVFNITFGASFSILVLYALERLGLSEVGFGLLLAASAVGGVVGSVLFPRFEARASYATLLRIGLVIETVTHLVLMVTTTAVVAGVVLFVFGVHAVTWGTISTTIRHRAVPEALLGRVTGVYLIGVVGSLAIGSLVGGLIAEQFGIPATFAFAGIGAGITTALVWRQITMVADAGT